MNFRSTILFFLLFFSLAGKAAVYEKAYGVRVYDDVGSKNAIVSFYTDNPSYIMDEINLDGLIVRAAAYADGAYYLMVAPTFTCDSLVKVDMTTGLRETIAVYELRKDLAVRLIVTDMTYDVTTSKLYALAVDVNEINMQDPNAEINLNLYTIDPTTGEAVYVGGQPSINLVTIAANSEGYLYGVDVNGTLWSINKRNGKPEEELSMAEVEASSLQSADFSERDGSMYWTRFNGIGNSELWKFTFGDDEITPSLIGALAKGTEVIGLHIDSNAESPSTPAEPTDFKAVAGVNGELKATLSWKNPQVNQRNEALQGTLKAKIYRNGEAVGNLDGVTAGQMSEWTDNTPTNGMALYQVSVINSDGEGKKATASEIFVGEDALGYVTELKAQRQNGDVSLSWSKPTKGRHGGWIGNSAITYKIVRLTDSLVVAESTEDTRVLDTNIIIQDGYSYSVTAYNAAGEGLSTTSNTVVTGPAATVPYRCDFSTDYQTRLWTIVDADGDGETWYRDHNYAGTSDWFMKYMSQSLLDPAVENNDWLLSAPIRLEAGKYYTLSYSIRLMSQSGLFPANYSVTLGTDNTVEAQNKVLAQIDGEENMMQFANHQVAVQVDADGEYTLGFQLRNRVPAQITNIELTEANGIELALSTLDGNRVPMLGDTSPYKVTVTNEGGQEVNAYTLSLMDENGNILAEKEVKTPIASKATNEETIEWTPEEKGTKMLSCKVTVNGDVDASNNVSDTIKVTVTSSGVWKTVGTGTNTSYNSPFGCYSEYTAAQTLYRKDVLDMEKGQKIEAVIYPYDKGAGTNITEYDLPVKVMVAQTDNENLNEALSKETFVTIYEGTTYLSPDRKQTEIVFDTPIDYDGGNLCIMTINTNGKKVPGYVFLCTKTPNQSSTQYYQGTTAFDWSQSMKSDKIYANASFLVTGSSTNMIVAKENEDSYLVDVYSITGQLIRKDVIMSKATDLLPAGIYIVGHKKIVVR